MEIYQLMTCVIFSFYLTTVHSIKCFQCNSAIDEGCDKLTVFNTTSSYLKDCNETYHGHPAFCRKTIYTILDTWSKRTIRACGWEVHKNNESNCYETDSDFKLERSCQCFEDACNSALNVQTEMLPIIGTLLYSIIEVYRSL